MEYFQLIRNFDFFSFWLGAVFGCVAALLFGFVLAWISRHVKTVLVTCAVVSAVSLLLLAV